jgi:SAM-dependent methyltransferase
MMAHVSRIKNAARRWVPRPAWMAMAKAKAHTLDAIDGLFGQRDAMTPRRSARFIGSGEFEKIGNEFLGHFVTLCGLTPDNRVLDVGCGQGRMAVPLTRFLSATGSYDGFDIVSKGIEWCRANISANHANFRFHHADVQNREYNPGGRFAAAEYRFPFDDGTFDFVFLTSIFTHMRAVEVRRYLAEIARVLKPGGRCLITWFLLNPESRALVAARRSELPFLHTIDGCLVTNKDVPEEAIAHPQELVEAMYADTSLTLESIRYGAWCGRAEFLSYQDVCVAVRPDPSVPA